ncbi:MAG TPA: hypothetical protein P5513_05130 [Candidatus Diapherotrites archaeon]|nr:hypothetical protein [Candidatus Diapherotrites archaeon]
MDIEEDVIVEINKILQEELYRLEENYFVPEAKIKQDLEITDAEKDIILDKLEYHFVIIIEDWEWDELKTLEDLYKLVNRKI